MAAAQGSELLVIVINERHDRPIWPGRYEMAIELVHGLGINYFEMAPFFESPADFEGERDVHWNNAGHAKAAKLVGDCIEVFIASGSLANCEHVVMLGGAS